MIEPGLLSFCDDIIRGDNPEARALPSLHYAAGRAAPPSAATEEPAP